MDDGSLWAAVGRMYDRDEVVAAHELAESLGTGEFGVHLGFYRSIEAEAATRRESRVVRLAEWLEFEYLPHEVRNFKALAEATLATCDLVAERLGWTHGAATRIAVLADEADAPWATNPHGYHSPRTDYDKICLPAYLQDDLGEFRQAIAHEYAHVVTHHLTEGRAPRWLSEAVSVLAERNFDARALKALAAGKWRSPGPLEAAFAGDEEGENPEWDVWLAYQQSGWIGRFLVSMGDERRLGDLLRAHVGGSTWGRVLALLQGRSPTDRALRQTYGLTVADLFEQARANL
ncbi:MAG: hypothetical protein M9921_00205 [Fimbriimonadaceae bacterium]|nr:hypothetical protein [Chthonomonadaceae bacterium]MCO5295258.1 hypothetical protein [Fimbriimonadaceae bacterium]